MPIALLPASAAAFAPRSPPTVVLGNRVDPWLTSALKRVNRRRPLNNVPHHHRALVDALSPEKALWSLCSLMLPVAPAAELDSHPDPLVRAMHNYKLLHVTSYVVHVDFVSQLEVAFKLTKESIDSLVAYHQDVYCKDLAADTWHWNGKERELSRLHDDFVQAINRYVFRTGVRALDALEEDGSGEVLDGRAEEVKSAILDMFMPLLPPPPRIVDLVHPGRLPSMSSSVGTASPQCIPNTVAPVASMSALTPPSVHTIPYLPAQHQPMVPSAPAPSDDGSSVASPPIDWLPLDWHVSPPTPARTDSMACSAVENAVMWSCPEAQLPSPTPSYSNACTADMAAAHLTEAADIATAAAATASMGSYYPATTTVADMSFASALPLPSVLAAAQCATAASVGFYSTSPSLFGATNAYDFAATPFQAAV